MDASEWYAMHDMDLLVNYIKTDVATLKGTWKSMALLGRPTITFVFTQSMLGKLQGGGQWASGEAWVVSLVGGYRSGKVQGGYITDEHFHSQLFTAHLSECM